MTISAQLAQNIIDSLASVLQQQLNFFDKDGTILASTAKNRIGRHHGGAAKLISEGLEELFIYRDGEYEGTLKGCNYSLEIDGKVIGAIGISGDCEEVYRYGQIIKKMTEIQIAESDAVEKKKIANRIRDRFFDDWILTDISYTDASFIRRAENQQININIQRRVMIFQLRNLEQYRDSTSGQKTIDSINRYMRTIVAGIPDALFSKTPSQMICLLPYRDDAALLRFADQVFSQIEEHFHEKMAAGVDSTKDRGCATMHQAYEKANRALNACLQKKDCAVLFYDEASYEMLLSEIPEHTREAFIHQIFAGCSEQEIDDFCNLIASLYHSNGSIMQTAAEHFIHKNTVQYKLNRIAEVTGYNPRSWNNIPLFYLAILFRERMS